jgi:hypothetical protein
VILALLLLGLTVTIALSAIGLIRGWRREAWTLGAMVAVWILALAAGPLLVALVNAAGRSIGFVLSGGLASQNTASIWQGLSSRPLVDPARPELLFAALFSAAIVASYAVPGRRMQSPATFGDRFAGLAMGCVNGYLVACALLKYGVPTALGTEARIAADEFGRFALLALAAAATMLVVYAWTQLRSNRKATARRRPVASKTTSRARRPRQPQARQR